MCIGKIDIGGGLSEDVTSVDALVVNAAAEYLRNETRCHG